VNTAIVSGKPAETAPIRRFPLVPRPRPACTPIADRVAAITRLAQLAGRDHDLAKAAAAFNQAALIASDCGQASLARSWCREHARAWLRTTPLTAATARYALEPVVNLARLNIRDGHGESAYELLTTLYEAITTAADLTIEGITIPGASFISTAKDYLELRKWLWTVYISDGTRALTALGRWQQALTHLRSRKGIGHRMFDGRQVAAIAHAVSGDAAEALRVVRDTMPGEPWEQAVTACLAVLCSQHPKATNTTRIDAMITAHQQLEPGAHPPVFRVRLGLTVTDTAATAGYPDAISLTRRVIGDAVQSGDGYAAREILAHPGCLAILTRKQEHDLTVTVTACHLRQQPLPVDLHRALVAGLSLSRDIIARRNDGVPDCH
jgi:hypothetical protein